MTEERAAYDPTAGMMDLKGKAYLPVAQRIVWFRHDHPEGRIETTIVAIDEDRGSAIFRAEVETGNGGRATATGSEERKDFPQGYIEKAEAKAVGRALGYLGYGTAAAFDEGERVVDAPQQRQPGQRGLTSGERATLDRKFERVAAFEEGRAAERNSQSHRGGATHGTADERKSPPPAAGPPPRAPQTSPTTTAPAPALSAGAGAPPAAKPEGSKAYTALVTWAWTLVEDGKTVAEVETFLNDKGDALSEDEWRLAQREFRAMRARIRERDDAAERQMAGARA